MTDSLDSTQKVACTHEHKAATKGARKEMCDLVVVTVTAAIEDNTRTGISKCTGDGEGSLSEIY